MFALSIANLLNLHGKQWSALLLGVDGPAIWVDAYTNVSYGITLVGSGAVIIAGGAFTSARQQLLALSASAFLFPVLVQLASRGHSVLIMVLQIYTGAAVGTVFFFRRYFAKPMPLEFWDRMVVMGLRAIRFGFIFYGALLALLKFISDGMKEGKDGFLSTALYPTITLLLTFFIWIVWLIAPAWERTVHLRALGHTTGTDPSDGSDDIESAAQDASKP
ncbi:hypothetical protein [Lacunisphaera limnophila]|nr:hypothetical protein [Lacunisphaera limnophila]